MTIRSQYDLHKHKCQNLKCKTVWQHTGEEGSNKGAHICPNCDFKTTERYYGSEPPIFTGFPFKKVTSKQS